MSTIDVTCTVSGLNGFLAADIPALFAQAGQKLAQQEAEATLAAAAPHVPVDTGQLLGSGRLSETDGGVLLDYTAPYALEVHGAWGETAARSEPRDVPISQLLGWAMRHDIPAEAVQHSIATKGTPYQRFLAMGLDEARQLFPQLQQQALDELKTLILGGG